MADGFFGISRKAVLGNEFFSYGRDCLFRPLLEFRFLELDRLFEVFPFLLDLAAAESLLPSSAPWFRWRRLRESLDLARGRLARVVNREQLLLR